MFKTINIMALPNKGKHKLPAGTICEKCQKAISNASDAYYTVHTQTTDQASTPASNIYHHDCAPCIGSGWGEFSPGKAIRNPSEVKVGDVLLHYSRQFRSYNTVRVTKTAWEGEPATLVGRKFYGVFANPADTGKVRMGGDEEMCFWDHEVGSTRCLYRALGAPHALVQCPRGNSPADSMYTGRGWKARFTCPECGKSGWQHLNYLGQRNVMCDGVTFTKVGSGKPVPA